jgi:DNA-binding protein HU-beta
MPVERKNRLCYAGDAIKTVNAVPVVRSEYSSYGGQTMVNKAVLAQAASKSAGVSLHNASACVDSIIEAITEGLSRGERVELRGLGSFSVKTAAARRTSFADVPAHGKVIFRPSQKLRESVWGKA